MTQGRRTLPEDELRVVRCLGDGMSREQAAEQAGVSKTAVSRIAYDHGYRFIGGRLRKVVDNKAAIARVMGELANERVVDDYKPIPGLRRWCEGCRGYVTTRGCLLCDNRKRREQSREVATA